MNEQASQDNLEIDRGPNPFPIFPLAPHLSSAIAHSLGKAPGGRGETKLHRRELLTRNSPA